MAKRKTLLDEVVNKLLPRRQYGANARKQAREVAEAYVLELKNNKRE